MGYAEKRSEIDRKTLMAYAERMLGDPVPFGTHDTGCPKCGRKATERRVNYCPGYQPLLEMEQPCKRMGEHLHCNCECGFSWMEITKDQQPENAGKILFTDNLDRDAQRFPG